MREATPTIVSKQIWRWGYITLSLSVEDVEEVKNANFETYFDVWASILEPSSEMIFPRLSRQDDVTGKSIEVPRWCEVEG